MIDPSGDRMQYQLYKDSTRTTAWGTVANATYTARTFNMSIGILSNGAAVSGRIEL